MISFLSFLVDPNSNAAGNSKTSPQDAANFQTFLGELRTALPSGALLTAAVSFLPFIGSDGNPVASVSRAAQALDYILIMNYDVWGSCESKFSIVFGTERVSSLDCGMIS